MDTKKLIPVYIAKGNYIAGFVLISTAYRNLLKPKHYSHNHISDDCIFIGEHQITEIQYYDEDLRITEAKTDIFTLSIKMI